MVTVTGLAVLLAGCAQPSKPGPILPDDGVLETGRVVDISDLHGGTTEVNPGDLLYLKLTGQAGSGYQWVATAPTSTSVFRLKDQAVDNLNGPTGTSTFEWWLKVMAPGATTLEFGYLSAAEGLSATYTLDILSR